MRTIYREKIYKCGKYIEINLYPAFKLPGQRNKKAKPSSKMQKRLNQKNAENNFIRVVNANFTPQDIKCELSYRDNPSDEAEAKRAFKNFIRRTNRLRKKLKLPKLKYAAVLERGSQKGRYHHHVIMSGGLSPQQIAELWGLGYVMKIQPLQFDECGICGIAKYMTKDRTGYRRWTGSKNLIHPQPDIRDGRLSQKLVRELAEDTENRRLYESVYEGYFLGQAEKVYNDVNGGVYLHIRMYKDGYIKRRERKRSNDIKKIV